MSTRVYLSFSLDFRVRAPNRRLARAGFRRARGDPLALNVPTFINLYGYGYRNVFELKGMHSLEDPEIHWVSDLQAP